MKKDIIISVSVIILGLLIAFSPKFLFMVCSPEMMSAMSTRSAINNSCCGDATSSIISDCCDNSGDSHNKSDNDTVVIGACGGPCGIGCGCGNSGTCVGEGCGTLGGICGEGKTETVQNDGCGNQHGACGGKCGSNKTITYPTCHWTAQAELALGFLIAALGLCMIVFNDIRTKLGFIISVFFSGIIVLFIPHGLIGGCGMMTMACRKAAFPAITILGVVLLVVSAVYAVYIIKKVPIENSEG